MITSLTHFKELASKKPAKKVVIAAAEDEYVIQSVYEVYKSGLIVPVLIGSKTRISEIIKKHNFNISPHEIIDEPDPQKSSFLAIDYILKNKNCILMKGLVSSAILLKEIIKKEHGLLTDKLLSHLGLVESPYYHKLVGISDAAININPTIEQKIEIILNAVNFFNKIGINKPKVAILSAIEKINKKIISTTDAYEIKKYFTGNKICNCIIDGPLALDNAISKKSAQHKNIKSEVAGDADILFTPGIDSGNILYKSLNFLGGAVTASIILGAKVPVIFTSRSDSQTTKLMSIFLAASL